MYVQFPCWVPSVKYDVRGQVTWTAPIDAVFLKEDLLFVHPVQVAQSALQRIAGQAIIFEGLLDVFSEVALDFYVSISIFYGVCLTHIISSGIGVSRLKRVRVSFDEAEWAGVQKYIRNLNSLMIMRF